MLKSPQLTYRVSTLKAESEEAALQYREFSDWYARLNAMTNHTPPFARLAVNQELHSRGLVATQVQLNIPKQLAIGGRGGVTLRSEHQIKWKLLKLDLDMITTTETQLGSFRAVSLEKFQQVGEVTNVDTGCQPTNWLTIPRQLDSPHGPAAVTMSAALITHGDPPMLAAKRSLAAAPVFLRWMASCTG